MAMPDARPTAVGGADYEAGRTLTLEQALAEAEEPSHASSPLAPQAAMPALTRREREIVALLAQGLTNRQIGAALVITEGTARLHVKHILHKLGFSTRAQVASWAVAQGSAPASAAR